MMDKKDIKKTRRKWCKLLLIFALSHVLLFSCDSIDCTLNNVVSCNYAFYASSSGTAITLNDTLTITTEGSDSILYNKGTKVSTLSLPMSYWQEADTLHFHLFNEETGLDTDIVIRVKKSNIQHFESPDCPTTMFHELQDVEFENVHGYVDSVVINSTSVNYASEENIKIYMHTDD